MKRSAAIFLRLTLTLVSLAAIIASTLLWRRSLHFTDLFYRFQPTVQGSAMRGFASMKGALAFGFIEDSSPTTEISGYRHAVWVVVTSGGRSLLQPRACD